MLWIKALHIIAIVSWFAGLFYLPRLFVYHTLAEDDISLSRFITMERKLYKGIMLPAMLVSLATGLALAIQGWAYYKTQGWLHAKLTLVVLLIGYHHICGAHLKRLSAGTNQKTHVYFRWFNEIPVVFLIAIVILVVVRPF